MDDPRNVMAMNRELEMELRATRKVIAEKQERAMKAEAELATNAC
jgi:hypothetical protein